MAKIFLEDGGALDDYVREYLEDVVQKHVKTILEHQLKDIVTGELARMKLLDPLNPVGVEYAISTALGTEIRKHVDNVVPNQLAGLLRKHYEKISKVHIP